MIKDGPEPLEKKINKMFGSKLENLFSDHPFCWIWYKKRIWFGFHICFGSNIFVRAAEHAKVFTEVPQDSWVLTAR